MCHVTLTLRGSMCSTGCGGYPRISSGDIRARTRELHRRVSAWLLPIPNLIVGLRLQHVLEPDQRVKWANESEVGLHNPTGSLPRMLPKLAPFSLKEPSKHIEHFYFGDHITGMGKCSLHTAQPVATNVSACPTTTCRHFFQISTQVQARTNSLMICGASSGGESHYILEGSASHAASNAISVNNTIKFFHLPATS